MHIHWTFKLFGGICFLLFLTILCSGCKESAEPALFKLLPSSQTNIVFNNLITESDSLNVLRFEYIYNGAGVGIGDFNNDGLSDIFFAGNMVSSKLYLNTGNLTFKDITTEAGTETSLWCTGVAVIDINQDGLLDIHVSTVHHKRGHSSANLLFVNQGNDDGGIPIFKEVSEQIGLADLSYSTQAAFFDYDLDGDLDMYLLTNALEIYNRNTLIGQFRGSRNSIDKLYRNEGIGANGLPVFKDVSKDAGLLEEGWGLGIAIADINNDGYPDVYVANDFQSNDLLYINDKNGGFNNQIDQYLRHQSHNSMGMDIADFNNDGLEDIIVVDMMPDDNLRQKTMFPRIEYDRFKSALEKGYQSQYVRNTLQLNNGNGSFSDIGYLAGIYATDWSWSALFADFDNDGHRDIIISNGYRKDVTNLDFVSYRKESTMFGTQATKDNIILESLENLAGVKKPSFIFKNSGNLTFTDKTTEWGLSQPSYSNGVAYADLDSDGDLDLVMNNINDEAFIYQNTLIESNLTGEGKSKNNFIRIKLIGDKGNTHGLGSKTTIHYGNQIQFDEHKLQRGYKTTVEPFVHFGLGSFDRLDSLVVIWPSGKKRTLRDVKVNQVVMIEEKDATLYPPRENEYRPQPFFKEVSSDIGLTHVSLEDDYIDYKTQRLLIQNYAQGGPGIAVGDINGDALDDLVIGAAAGHATRIFLQRSNGSFFLADSISKKEEDMGILLFDADNDGDLDLYCVSGSSEFGDDPTMYQDRFYRNNGNGKFEADQLSVPVINSSGGTVRACDFDKDGDLDLFIGGRVSPGKYPLPPVSYLLRNDGTGKFEDVTVGMAAALNNVGMVTDALWSDFDNDGWVDLILVGEYMPVTFFKNESGKALSPLMSSAPDDHFLNQVGFWNSIVAGDFDNDGDIDYVAGNLGLNSFLKASDKEPVSIYAKDYDDNGSIDPILTHFNGGKEYVVHYRETLIDQLAFFRKKLTRYDTYGKATFPDLFTKEMLKDAYVITANQLSSTYIKNLGQGKFSFSELPVHAQIAPIFGMQVLDYNLDGNLDILAVGNSYASEPLSGWYDAGIGTVLRGDGKGNFTSLNVKETGFFINGDAKAFVEILQANDQSLWVATQNQDSIRAFRPRLSDTLQIVRILPADQCAEILFSNGQTRKQEFYFGSGYLSQSSRVFKVPVNATAVNIVKINGEKRVITIQK